MFRKLTDKISAAANAVMGNDDQAVQTLQSMGFSAENARNALQATNGDVDRAADLLLTSVSHENSSGMPSHTSANNNTNSNANNEAALNAAMQESLQIEEARQMEAARLASKSTANNNSKKPAASAASSRAGQAAVARAAKGDNPFPANSKSALVQPLSSHPNVKMPTKLQQMGA